MTAALASSPFACPPRDSRWPLLERLAAERFGITRFRAGQRELIDAVLAGSDAIGILPTGGGKSLTFQLPALVFDRPVLVVSPLIALMKDQCDHLARAHVDAAELDSTLRASEERAYDVEIRAGAHPIIYVTPERLQSEACIAMLRARGVSLIAVDEAHCVSQWGHDFRPAYLGIAAAAEKLGRPPILALTATATPETEADIIAQLGLRTPRVVHTSIARDNLTFEVRRTVNEMAKRVALIELLDAEDGPGRAGIVYVATVKKADELFGWMAALPDRIPVARYHGKMSASAREKSRECFMSGTARVMVATKAFGMGIDKPNIRWVAHYQLPDSLESYYQEAGRAGRDGNPARCVLFFRLEDKRVQSYFLLGKYPTRADIKKVCDALVAGASDDVAVLAKRSGVRERRARQVVGALGHISASVAGAEREGSAKRFRTQRRRGRNVAWT